MISKRDYNAICLAATLALACGREETKAPEETADLKPAKVETASAQPAPDKKVESPAERARRVHFDSLVMDGHADTVMRIVDDGVDLGVRTDEGHIDLPRMKEGGLDAQVFAVWVSPEFWPDKAKNRALQMIDALHGTAAKYPDKMGLATDVETARKLVVEGKVAAFLGIEGGHAIENDVDALKTFYDKGVRYMTLTWWNNTDWADGSGDKPKCNGLCELGEKVVKEMNRLGMVVDVSHVSDDTFWDVLKIADKPVIASHSDIRSLHDHHRNMSDEMLKALAKNGGVIGINYVAGFLDTDFSKRFDELREKLKPELDAIEAKYKDDPIRGHKERWKFIDEKSKDLPPVMLEKVIDHIDHAVKVAGIDHVGLGSDFDGFTVGAKELSDCTKLPLITEKLLERGYSEEDVAKILGENLLRVFKENIGR